jgi:hypothetical protein
MKRARLVGFLVALALCGVTAVQAGASHSMNLKLDSAATLKGEKLSPGDYRLSWTAEGTEADLTIAQGRKVVAKAHATLVEKEKPAGEDMVLFRKGSDGLPMISEIHHRGEKAVIVLTAS